MELTIKLVFEAVPGSPIEHEVGMIEQAEEISPATVGLTIAEGKALLASPQEQIVRYGGPEAVSAVGLALRHCGVNEATSVTVLTDGDAGLQAIHQQVAPHAEHILDWFHIAMRFKNLEQLTKGINAIADGGLRGHALAEIDHAKWRLWNGLTGRGTVGLIHLGQWAQAPCFGPIPSIKKLAHTLLKTKRYLELNADSMPDYGKRCRAGQRTSGPIRCHSMAFIRVDMCFPPHGAQARLVELAR